jgi:NAD(P)-dependent dehydrogenase (short-subunit alcohol dehydrogenase family)
MDARIIQPGPLGAAALSGRHVVVTGASRGIGAAVVRELAAAGARVTLIARDPDRLEALRRALEAADGGTVVALRADITDGDAARKAIAIAESSMGPVYALVNNAGAAETAAFLETTDAQWRRMIDVNLMGAVFCTRAVLRGMLALREGRIVNVSSTAGIRGYRYVAAYVAAKHALVGFTRALALETERDGVSVNVVCPGYTRTEMLIASAQAQSARGGKSEEDIMARYASANEGGRLVEPLEVAQAIGWLCSPSQKQVTGRVLVVDGGPVRMEASS